LTPVPTSTSPKRGARVKRCLWTGWAVFVVVAATIKILVFGEISPRQYAVLTSDVAVSSETWRNEIRRALIDADYISVLNYHRLLADLPASVTRPRTLAPAANRRTARYALVRALVF
jgi:hypothetical protein